MDAHGVSTGADRPSTAEPEGDVRTFLIADVRGYTSFTQAYGDEEAGKLAAKFADLAREAVVATGGDVVELRGDEALCVFRSARQALRAAVELQARFRERVDGQPVFPLGIGIGLDAGEAVPVEDGYRGGALNLASRLCSLAKPGQILASDTVTSLARAIEGVRLVDRRRAVRVKGIEKRVRVIEVVPEIALPPVPDALAGRARRRRRGLLLMAVGVVLLAAAVAAGILLSRDGDAEAVAPSSGVGRLDPTTGELLDAIPLGVAPSDVAVGEGAAWVIDANDQTVSRIDTSNPGDPQTFSTGSTPSDLAVGAGAVWVTNLGSKVLPESVSRLDPDTKVVVETIDLPRRSVPGLFWGGGGAADSRQHIAVTRDAVWAINPDLTVSHIDPRTNRLMDRVDGVQAVNIAAGDGGVWIVDGGDVAEIDPRTNTVKPKIRVPAESLTTLAVGGGAVWATDPQGGSVWRIDPDPDPDEVVLRQIPLDKWVAGIAYGEGAVWATNEIADKVYRIDPRTNRARVVGGLTAPRGVAVGEGAAWVTTVGPPSADAALPTSVCDEVFYGGEGKPQFLLVSDLPLRDDAAPTTRFVVEGIRFALDQRGFEAGRYTVGYQSCDYSTAQGGTADEYRCLLNAKAYARKLEVMAVIGPWNSFCAYLQIPVANQAPQGPLAMISPANTTSVLTRGPESESLYPSGERNFVRIAAADHLLAVSEVELARELRAESVFVLGDFWDMAPDARRAARNLGLDVAGSANWNYEARDFAPLARRIARSQPDAVTIFGVYERNEGELLRDLRAALGPDVPLIANDGFMVPEGLVKAAGPAARGMYVGYYGVPNGELPPAGERFLEEFEAARGGGPTPSYSATYGAQAAEIVLDAIARSDGTRASVNTELRRTIVEDGILGDIRFDENGDLVEGPVGFFRAVGPRQPSSTILADHEGYAFDRVIMARADPLE